VFDLTLTFDNGPEPEVTPFVLDVLARRGIRASFFVLGRKIATPEGRRLAERARDEGHWIGNHTWTHAVPLGLMEDAAAAVDEVARTQAVLGGLVHPDHLFRPFGGGGNLDDRLLRPEVASYLQRFGYTVVVWNAVPRDWVDPEGWVETALRQCTQRPWTQLVIHDLPTGAMAQLERFFDLAGEAGARIRQDFNPDCVPMRRGVPGAGLAAFVRGQVGTGTA
jgi:peptidoglycan-N-acetylglucosamine deacetylase